MNNQNVLTELNKCDIELHAIGTLITNLGATSTPVPYLSKYALIKACGTVEQAFKSIIADKCLHRSKPQVKQFLRKKVTNNSSNPSYGNICSLLKDFDNNWSINFKAAVTAQPTGDVMKASLESLVDARNEFAHGGSPRLTIGDVITYFSDARKILICMDTVVG